MKKIITILICLLIGVTDINSQIKSVTLKKRHINGKVFDAENNEPLIGVTVLVKGTTNGVATDINGDFEITANKGDLLVFTAIGYKNEEISVSNQSNITLKLKTDAVGLSEIYVVGYGTVEKRDLTGAVSSIKPQDLQMKPVSFDNALAGRVAGMQINSSSGVPGSATSIVIRGLTSINSDANNPLIVIDGIPVYGTGQTLNKTSFNNNVTSMVSMGGGGVSGAVNVENEFERNPLSTLNPEDIESIEVLKDAFSTAIYGSRGAAGVILITTKKGVKGKTSVNFGYSTTFSRPIGLPNLLDADQYYDFYSKVKDNEINYPKGNNTDWLNEIVRTGVTHDVSATISSGSDKHSYMLSLSMLDQGSYIIGQDYKRYTVRANSDNIVSKKFKYGTTLTISYTNNNSLNAQTIYSDAILKSPMHPVRDEDGNFTYISQGDRITNPVAMAEKDENYLEDTRIFGNLYAEYKPFSFLTLKSEGGVDFYNTKTYNRKASTPNLIGGFAIEGASQNRKLVMNNTATFVKLFGKHSLNAVIGQSFETSKEQRLKVSGRGFSNDNIKSIGFVADKSVDAALTQEWALFSMFGRINYQYNNRYMIGATYRVDGSSRFNKNHRYVGFPSLSFGWRASEESFLKDIKVLDNLKFRGSYGLTGIDGSGGYYGDQGQYTQGGKITYAGISRLRIQQPSNPDIKWEMTRSIDLGMDLSMFDNRLEVVFDYYYKRISNMFFNAGVPYYLGFASQKQNVGDMMNTGYELSINTINIDGELQWITNFNFATNRNELLKLTLDTQNSSAVDYTYMKVGEPVGQFYLYDWAYVDANTGQPMWRYEDGTVSDIPPASLSDSGDKNKTTFGTPFPDIFGGVTNTFKYKGFELTAFVNYSFGNKLMNGSKAQLMSYRTNERNNLSTDVLGYWKISGHYTDIPKINNNSNYKSDAGFGQTDYSTGQDSDRFLEDASYVRLKNITLAYNWKLNSFDRDMNIKFYIQALNMYTWTKYSGIDPEVSAFGSSALNSGYDLLTMPQSKSWMFGVKVNF